MRKRTDPKNQAPGKSQATVYAVALLLRVGVCTCMRVYRITWKSDLILHALSGSSARSCNEQPGISSSNAVGQWIRAKGYSKSVKDHKRAESARDALLAPLISGSTLPAAASMSGGCDGSLPGMPVASGSSMQDDERVMSHLSSSSSIAAFSTDATSTSEAPQAPLDQSGHVQRAREQVTGMGPTGSPTGVIGRDMHAPALDIGSTARNRMRQASLAAAEYKGKRRAPPLQPPSAEIASTEGRPEEVIISEGRSTASQQCRGGEALSGEDSSEGGDPEMVSPPASSSRRGAAEVVTASSDVYGGRKSRGSADAEFLTICPP